MSIPCKVLVVDDDADTREALADALTYAGYLVEQACAAAKRSRAFRSRAFPT